MISLRAYNQEIEQLIDNGQYEESIAHCRTILSKHPKCIDTYRNLGKTLLELKKYPEALDIFSRVLSAFPDDFISHVGLSIIYEDQNDLDLAIWHMEQSFDVQPSNLAIQDELKRLFGRRDGEQPIKIRLTRGALVRMYARGELYQQAISEIESILEEDPRRIDLEVIFARMKFLSGSVTEAISSCNKILERFPYCFEANRILQEIYTANKELERAAVCRNRLISLDPYYRFLSSPHDDKQIPDEKILLEKLVFSPSERIDIETPVWINTIDDQWDTSSEENIDWLQDVNTKVRLSPNAEVKPNTTNPIAEASLAHETSQSGVQLPDWMQNAGWASVSDAPNNDPHLQSNQDDTDVPFLNQLKNFETENHSELAELNDFSNDNNNQTHTTNGDLASLFSELKEGKMNDDNLNSDGDNKESFPPSDWKSQFSKDESNEISDSQSQDIPDWLKNFEKDENDENNETDNMPDWLKNLQDEVEPASQGDITSEISAHQDQNIVESTLQLNEEDQIPGVEEAKVTQDSQKIEGNNGWEKVDLTKNETEEGTAPVNEEFGVEDQKEISSEDTIPDWVKSVLSTNTATDEQISDAKLQTGPLDNEDIFTEKTAQIIDEGTPEIPSAQDDSGIISQQTNDELLDWLRGLKVEDTNFATEEIEQSIPSILTEDNKLDIFESPIEDQTVPNFEPEVDKVNSITDQIMADQLLPIHNETTLNNNVESISEKALEDELAALFTEETAATPEETVAQTGQLHSDQVVDSDISVQESAPVFQNNSELEELMLQKSYDLIPNAFSQRLSSGEDFDQLLESIRPVNDDQLNDYSYWQCLGDILSRNNKLTDALSAYQKAEDILLASFTK